MWLRALSILILVLATEAVDAVAPLRHRETRFAAHVGETFYAIAAGILHKVEFPIEEVVMFKGNGAFFMHDKRDGAMHAANPVGQVSCVADRRGEAHQAYMGRRANDGLFPHGAASNIAQEVQFIKDNIANVG